MTRKKCNLWWSCDKHLGGHSIGRQKSWIFSSADFSIVKDSLLGKSIVEQVIFLKVAISVVCERIQVEFFLRCHLNCLVLRISRVFIVFLQDFSQFWKKFLKILDFAYFCRLFHSKLLNACRSGRPTAAHSNPTGSNPVVPSVISFK